MARGGAGAETRSLPVRLAARLPAASPSHLLTQAHGALRAAVAQEAEQRRLFPWLAVAFGLGILVEFHATDGPPALAAPLLAAGAAAAVTPLLRARPVALALTLAFVAALLGFAAAAYRVASVASPVLARPVIVPLAGLVEALDEREEGARLIVRVTALGTLSEAERPARVRVSYRRAGAAAGVRPGDAITATARLLPPPEAARPGGYDFARDAYFRGIGAVGSLVGRIDIRAPEDEQPWTLRAAAGIDAARNALTRRIGDAIGGQAGAVAAALVTGKRGLIAPATNDVLRAAGIYHVVSISGLHMVLAAGVVFWLTRALLCLVPALALAAPVKKIAAATAMLGVTAYCAFSGWDIAAERSWIMTLVMLGAILVDRPALSMRNLALAAMIALAREPEALLGPSFRMSFGAVAGLIASAPLLDRLGRAGEGGGALARLVARAVVAIAATLGTTLVAQIATAPFSTYHFQAVQPFGLLGNALTLPLVSLVVMPSAVIGVLAYPFALDRPVWWLMGLAVRGMLEISAWIAAFGQANLVLPAYGPAALALFSVALLLATLPVTRLRLLAIAPALAGLALAANPPRPDLYVDRAAAGLALRGADGRLALLGRPSGFVLEQWLRADGDARRPDQVGAVAGARCDRLGCTARSVDGRRIALAKDGRALPEDCARADILVTHRSVPPGCAAGLILDRTFLATHGAAAIRLGSGDAIVTTVRRPGPPRVEDAASAGRANPQQAGPIEPMGIPVGEPGEAGLADLSPGDVPAEPLQ